MTIGEQGWTAERIQDRVIYRDGLMLVLNKPAGFAVHPGPGKDPNLQPWFQHLRYGLPRDPSIAHRLDKDTSGCLILGRHAKPLRRLNDLFAKNRVEKTYWAIVHGTPPAATGDIALPLVRKRLPHSFGFRMEVALAAEGDPEAQEAHTAYKVLGAAERFSWLELKPTTGRTHQLRVHCAALGCPIVGDEKYGQKNDGQPLHLHARAVAVPLYPNKEAIYVEAPLGAAMELFRMGLNNSSPV